MNIACSHCTATGVMGSGTQCVIANPWGREMDVIRGNVTLMKLSFRGRA